MAKESRKDLEVYFQEAAYALSLLEQDLKKMSKKVGDAQLALLHLYQIAKDKDE